MRILKIDTLPSVKDRGWIDRDYIMLHACFQILVDYVEEEGGLTHCDYNIHKETLDTLKTLYDWWKSKTYITIFDTPQEEIDNNLNLLIKHRGFLWT